MTNRDATQQAASKQHASRNLGIITCMAGKKQTLGKGTETAGANATATALANKGTWINRHESDRHQSKVGGVSPLQADLLSPQQHDPRCCTAAAFALN